jgi:hypothetical protein
LEAIVARLAGRLCKENPTVIQSPRNVSRRRGAHRCSIDRPATDRKETGMKIVVIGGSGLIGANVV